MPNQLGKNLLAAYKVEATLNTAPGAAGGKRIRINPCPGLSLQRDPFVPNEVRSDLNTPTGRFGMHKVGGSYSGDLYVAAWNDFLEAALMSTFVTDTTITFATMTTVAVTGTNTITATAGSWLTQGVRVGQIIRLTGTGTSADNDINLRVTAVTASNISVAGTPLTNFGATATGSLVIKKKLTSATSPVRRSFYVEQYNVDIDATEIFGGVRVAGFKITCPPNGMATIEFTLVGMSGDVLTGASAPYYTTPTLNTNIGLVGIDSSIRFGGTDITTLSGFELSVMRDLSAFETIGNPFAADVFEDNLVVSGQITGLRTDLNNLLRVKNETELELHALFVEPEAAALQDFLSVFCPVIKLGSATGQLGQSGGFVETLPFTGGLKTGVTGYDDPSSILIATSA